MLLHRCRYGTLLFIIPKHNCIIDKEIIPYYRLIIFGVKHVIAVYISYKSKRQLNVGSTLDKHKVYYTLQVIYNLLYCFEIGDFKVYVLFAKLSNNENDIRLTAI